MRNADFAALAALIVLAFASPGMAGDGRPIYPEGSIFREANPPNASSLSSTVPHGGGATARSAHLSPLDPLDAPDAGNVWKPSNRDAGNLAEERWTEYTAHRADGAAAQVESQASKSDAAHRSPSSDSFGDFFTRLFR